MNLKQFEKKYSKVGGMNKLIEMRALLMPLKNIAETFGVSRERVRQWMLEFFGEKYDPRPDRRKRKQEILESGIVELKEQDNTII